MATKQEIIEEIKRTAKLNNGKALGQERFTKETGFKKNDWYPHCWLRWSDAIKEADLSPNQFTMALNKDIVIKKLIDFIKELGHFPIHGELRVKAKQDSSFPSHGVFDKFGGKKKLTAAVVTYCRAHGGLDEILKICGGHASEDGLTLIENIEPQNEIDNGFVYLMKSGRYFKIGHTVAIGRRHREIKTQMPEEVNMVHYIRTDDPSGIEAYWHKRFAGKRKNGEWFDLTRADVNAFKRRKKFM